jgi:hypothetical protein
MVGDSALCCQQNVMTFDDSVHLAEEFAGCLLKQIGTLNI